ncbi:MAG: DUF3127 domain-containing protein [Bacteroidia bacterium]|nr:DUF3127 domain-containing protein [Bacteroidia bacterium]
MSLEITAKLLYSLPEQTGQGKNGTWVKQDFIVETEEQYPKKVCMSAWSEMVGQFKSYPPGTRLKISFRVESREYNGRWYTDVRPYKASVEAMAAGAGAPMDTPQADFAPSTSGPVAAQQAEDDLPF